MSESDPLTEAFSACEALARDMDKDRWLASLFIPERHRRDVLALVAFNAEIASVRDKVSSPLPGEVRLQWWRDAIQGAGHGAVTAHPVAAALLDTVARCRLPQTALIAMTEARIHDLYDDLFADLTALEAYCGETAGALFQLCALVLADMADPATGTLSGHAGCAYAMTGHLRAFASLAARGQVMVPQSVLADFGVTREAIIAGREEAGLRPMLAQMRGLARGHLDAVRRLIGAAPPEVRSAFLPLALCDGALRALDRAAPFASDPAPAQWRRQWALWRASRNPARL
jgi:phytoene synthase